METGPSIAEILREVARARAEARIISPARGTRFSEHLARSPLDEAVPFDVFLKRQNKELRAARAASCLPCGNGGRVIDVYG